MLSLRKEADSDGYSVTPDEGAVVGPFELFDAALLGRLKVVAALLRSPESLACLLEAAGAIAL